jgi:serine kinase of HPr protein (carbohydrate metabolism regulator)
VILHAGLIARRLGGYWRGVLIEGPSGSGKSDLALRALHAGWVLVADDRTRVWASGGQAFGAAPPTLAGLIEARGLGVISRPMRPFVSIALAVRCAPSDQIERAPEIASQMLAGVAIPTLALACRESSGPAKLAEALTRLGLARQPAYQACRAGLPRPAGGDS